MAFVWATAGGSLLRSSCNRRVLGVIYMQLNLYCAAHCSPKTIFKMRWYSIGSHILHFTVSGIRDAPKGECYDRIVTGELTWNVLKDIAQNLRYCGRKATKTGDHGDNQGILSALECRCVIMHATSRQWRRRFEMYTYRFALSVSIGMKALGVLDSEENARNLWTHLQS